MKSITAMKLLKSAACIVLVIGLGASAMASCGDTLSAMAIARTAVVRPSGVQPQDSSPSPDRSTNSSIVGLWHIEFNAGGETIQEAYQLWNAGGTEVHNPNVDPRGGNVCLGVWTETSSGAFKLTHRVWNYATTGDFEGTIHLRETVELSQDGNKQTGSFALDFYDTSGNFLMEVSGNVTGRRISVE